MLALSRSLILVVASLAVVALAGCAPTDNPAPLPIPNGSIAPSEQPAAADDPGAPLDIECSSLVSDQAIYDYNANFGIVESYTPTAGSTAAHVVEQGGTACAWQNETSGEMIVVAAANPSSEELASLQEDSAFAITNGAGTAQAFSGNYWIVASSEDFLEEGDAKPILDAAIATLG